MKKNVTETTWRFNRRPGMGYATYPVEQTERARAKLSTGDGVGQIGGESSIFVERGEGTPPAYNIRTDKRAIAENAMDVVTRSQIARRQYIGGDPANGIKGDGSAEGGDGSSPE